MAYPIPKENDPKINDHATVAFVHYITAVTR